MDEKPKQDRDEKRQLTSLEEMRKKAMEKPGHGRRNLLGKKVQPQSLPVSLEYGKDGMRLQFDLNQLPHLAIVGGTSACQSALFRKISNCWEPCSWIEPVMVDLTGETVPTAPPATAAELVEQLEKMTGLLQNRYDELREKQFRSAAEYLNAGYRDMPFRPLLISGFEKLSGSKLLPDAVSRLCRLTAKGRAAGIDLVLGTTDAKLLNGALQTAFPAKLLCRSGDAGDLSFSSPLPGLMGLAPGNASK